VAESLRLVQGQKLEESTLVFFEFHLELDLGENLCVLEGLDAGVVLPDEALQLCGPVGELGRSLRKNLLGVRLVHVVGLGFAPLVHLVSLYEAPVQGVVLFELEVTRSAVVAQHTGDGQVFRASVEHHLGGLTHGRTHPHGSQVHGVVPTVEGHLELEVVFVIDREFCLFAHQLLNVDVGSAGGQVFE